MSTFNFYAKLNQLPVNIQKEVNDFIEFLFSKHLKSQPKKNKKTAFTFKWEGAIKKSKLTSVELQHLSNEWRNS
jgi:hypothetical protein